MNLLNNIKNTAMISGKDAENEHETIYASDNAELIYQKIVNRFKVGDFIEISGTEAIENHSNSFILFPRWMELRVRCNRETFVIFYPKGYLVWNKLSRISHKIFKCELDESTLTYKIWRSK